MKNTWIVKLALLFVLIGLSSCNDLLDDCIRANKRIVTETRRNLPFFHSLVLEGSYDLEITYGNDFHVELEGPSNIINHIQTIVDDKTLTFYTNECFNSVDKIKVYVTMPVVEAVWLKGSGNIVSTNTLIANNLSIYLDGSGNIDIELDAAELRLYCMGSGNVDLYGLVDYEFITIDGSGDIHTFNLEALETEVEIIGSGNVEVKTLNELDVSIRGSGSVYYKGNPNVRTSISGSGGVFDVN
jgi:hypothetical protein